MAKLLPDQILSIARQHLEAGRIPPAEDLCRQLLDENPRQVDALRLLAAAARQAGRSEALVALLQRAIAIDPRAADLHAALGGALFARSDARGARHAYQAAIDLDPNQPIVHYNFGNALLDADMVDEAIASYRRAIALRPDFAEAFSNLGNALTACNEIGPAMEAYSAAIDLQPSRVEPRWNRALLSLLLGDFENGWRDYELRQAAEPAVARSGVPWNGEDLAGRSILLFAEQGLGDTIQFVRYFEKVAERARQAALECPPELRRLLTGEEVAAPSMPAAPRAFDYHCSLLSLPRIFSTRADSIPNTTPYIRASPALIEAWRDRLGPANGPRRVGLAWFGRPEHQHDRQRSIDLPSLAPLLKIKHIEFHSLQNRPMKHRADDFRQPRDHSAALTDFAQTAALIANLDLVITVDTAVAHLAGAMGKPTWLLLAFAPDWRWQLERTDSPWYPTMKLFRQPTRGDWQSVIARVIEHLRD